MYCVVYRTGGKLNFTWHRSVSDSKEETEKRLKTVQRQGYKAHIEKYKESLERGLPTSFTGVDLSLWYDFD